MQRWRLRFISIWGDGGEGSRVNREVRMASAHADKRMLEGKGMWRMLALRDFF
jgi:hypothetical protein